MLPAGYTPTQEDIERMEKKAIEESICDEILNTTEKISGVYELMKTIDFLLCDPDTPNDQKVLLDLQLQEACEQKTLFEGMLNKLNIEHTDLNGAHIAQSLSSDNVPFDGRLSAKPLRSQSGGGGGGGGGPVNLQKSDSRLQQRVSCEGKPASVIFLVKHYEGCFEQIDEKSATHYAVLAIECKGHEKVSPDLYMNFGGYTYEIHRKRY